MIFQQKSGNIYMYVNGSSKVEHQYYDKGGSVYDHGSPNGVFKLKQGDTVHIYMSGAFYFPSSQCKKTYFQGHLIDLL